LAISEEMLNFVAVNHNYSLKLNAYENKKNQELQEFG
jgi:hypothetical protein